MDELVRWLGEQLDEDERIARACPGNGEWTAGDIGFYGPELSPQVRAHMAAHDPARVLREIDAKLRLVELHALEYRDRPERVLGEADDPFCTECSGEAFPCETLRLLALPYADRPGYREEWRP